MVARIEHTTEAIAEARRLYERTLTPIVHIMAMLGLSKSVFYKRVRAWGWRRRRAKDGAFELARGLREFSDDTGAPRPADQAPVTPERRQALAERIQTVIERQMGVIEKSVGLFAPSDQPEAECALRGMALVTRALADVVAINQPPAKPNDDSSNDPVPFDIDELREEIARRLRGLMEARGH